MRFASPARSCISPRWTNTVAAKSARGWCQTDEQLDEFVRSHAETAFHPCGSCKMGYDEMAVVDGEGRVHGSGRLRVVDASIMRNHHRQPERHHIMIGEKLLMPFAGASRWRRVQRHITWRTERR